MLKHKKTVVFDFGGVLLDWNPRYLFNKVFSTPEQVENFLSHANFASFNAQADEGRSFESIFSEVSQKTPEHLDAFKVFPKRFLESLSGPIWDNVFLLESLKKQNIPLYGLTNWSRETFPLAYDAYPFFKHFDGILVSGEEHLAKPDPKIFHRLCEKFKLHPELCFFLDDNPDNIRVARELGFNAYQIHAKNPDLTDTLQKWLGDL